MKENDEKGRRKSVDTHKKNKVVKADMRKREREKEKEKKERERERQRERERMREEGPIID